MSKSEIYKKHKQCMAIHVLILIIDLVCTFLSSYYLASFVDVFLDYSYKKGCIVITKLAWVLCLQLMCSYMKNRYWTAYKEKKTNEVVCSVYEKYLMSSVNSDGEGKLSVICEKDISQCIDFFVNTIPLAIQASIGAFVYAGYFVVKNDGIGIFVLLLVLSMLHFLPPFITKKYFIQNYVRAGQEEELLCQEVISGLSGFFTIKMLNLQQWFIKRYIQKQQAFRKVGERAAATSSLQSALSSGVSLIQQLGFLVVGIYGVDCNWFTLETLIEAYVLSGSFYQYIARIGGLKIDVGVSQAAENRIISFFHNDKRRHIMQELNMTLPKKGIYLIKGENGAGKTTLFSVISGYNHGDEKIVRNGKILSAETRIRMTGWCPQLYLQLSESFDELVALIPDEEIDLDFLKKCNEQFRINRELLHKPLNQLSGGEQKKLMLSLTLAKKCEMVLLDEPEVSLDREGVDCLKDLIKKEQRLILLVTHISVFDDIASGVIQVIGGRVYEQNK